MAEVSTHQQLDQMITGYWISQAIYAAAKFGIADFLKDGPKTVISPLPLVKCAYLAGAARVTSGFWK
jgi:hypothetical protein